MTNISKDIDDRAQRGRHAAARVSLEGLVSLPPLPQRSQELLHLLTDPDLDILTLIDIIEQTPALAARILGVAASPFFKSPMPARDLSDAIIRLLGLSLVRDLSLSLILSQPFELRRCSRFDPLRYWKHAMMTATLAQSLAPAVQLALPPSASDGYLGGLLHSLGLLALAHVAPEAMDRVLEQAAARPEDSLSQLEQDVLGMDHCAAGGAIATAWHLPRHLFAAMRHHRDLHYRAEHWPLVRAVALADRASKSALAGGSDSDTGSMDAALAELGIGHAVWERILERWQERIANIEAIASVLASKGP